MTAPDRVEELRAAQEEVDREVLAGSVTFPTYEVPGFVLERFPGFDPTDPSTWPEPDRCTEGRPWGHDAYSFGPLTPERVAATWQTYLANCDRPAARRPNVCRNRWRDADARLCGTHVKPYRETTARAARRRRIREAELLHLDLAKRLGEWGVTGDGMAQGVLLQADAVRDLLELLNRGPVDLTTCPPHDPDGRHCRRCGAVLPTF
jgi:hypothetical protein